MIIRLLMLLLALNFAFAPLKAYAAKPLPEGQISKAVLKELMDSFKTDNATKAGMNSITANEIDKLTIDRKVLEGMDKNFSHVIRREGVTDQQKSGRCWIFAGLNIVRYRIAKKLEQPDFELSQNFSFFWHKLELSNYFLEKIIETRDKNHDDREVEWLYKHAVGDGGYWNNVVTTINKYGVVPKSIFPETISSENTGWLNKLLDQLVKKHAVEIRKMAKAGKTLNDLRAYKKTALKEVYRLLALTLGEPPSTFVWRHEIKEKDDKKDKKKDSKPKFSKYSKYTPRNFLKKWCDIKLENHLRLYNDPSREYYKKYTVKWTKNVYEDTADYYINLPIEDLIKYTSKSLLKDIPVWFACDIGKQRDWDKGVAKADLRNFKDLFGIDFSIPKADRIKTYSSALNHAMVFTGIDIQGKNPVKWLVENSWGTDKTAEKGYWIMYTDWFKEYVFATIIQKNLLDKKILDVAKQKPIELKPWDPMW